MALTPLIECVFGVQHPHLKLHLINSFLKIIGVWCISVLSGVVFVSMLHRIH